MEEKKIEDRLDDDVAELLEEQVILKNCPVPLPRIIVDVYAALVGSVYGNNLGAYADLAEICAKKSPSPDDKITALIAIGKDYENRLVEDVERDFGWLRLVVGATTVRGDGRLVIEYTKVETVPTAGP